MLGLDLGVPQHALGGSREGLERALGQLAILRRQRARGAHTAASGGFPEFRQRAGYTVVGRPGPDGVPYGHEELGSQCRGGLGSLEAVEDLLEGGRRDHGGGARVGSEADDRVVVRRLPVPREQQRRGLGELALRLRPQESREALV